VEHGLPAIRMSQARASSTAPARNITIQADDDDLRQGFDRIEGLVGQPD